MKKIQLGSSNLKVSVLGLGCVDFGTKISEKSAFKVLDAYYDAGGNFLDTSNNYAVWFPNARGGESETVIGNWMRSRNNREDIIIATKCGANPKNISDIKNKDGSLIDSWWDHGEGLSRESINNAIQGSLKRLQTSYIDLYYAHIDNDLNPMNERLETFNILKENGKIKAIGCSNHYLSRLKEALEISSNNKWIEYCCIQQLYTYLKGDITKFGNDYARPDLVNFLKQNENVKLIAYSPTLWGAYAKIETRSQNALWHKFSLSCREKRLNTLEKIAKNKKCSITQMLYAWLIQSSPKSIPLMATGSVEHTMENLGCLDIILTKEELELLDNA